MKRSILATLLVMFSASTFAVEPFIGLYGAHHDDSPLVEYSGNDGGVYAGLEGNWWAFDATQDFGNHGMTTMGLRVFTDLGNFRLSVGAGGAMEHASATDTTGNWDSKTIGPNSHMSAMGVVQVEHTSGLFVRYFCNDYKNDFNFRETAVVGGHIVVVDSKTVSVNESRNTIMAGFKTNF